MRTQQVPNSPYFIHYDDNGYCCVSRDKDGKEPIPESETQAFLAAVANGLLYIEKERKNIRCRELLGIVSVRISFTAVYNKRSSANQNANGGANN